MNDPMHDENSPLKLNRQTDLDESALESSDNSLELKSAFDRSDEYEKSNELLDHYDYKNVRLKENVFYGYEEQKNSLHFLIKNAIGRGESGTVLVYGGPGSGKTTLVRTVLQESELAKCCRILKLSGLMHSNDVSTIHHIAKFLGLKFTDLPRMMDQFKEECRNKMANLIVVLDEFDVFCDHKNQYLLYNFFDLIQYVGHILVIGVSTRYDCIELLEKRVKSRMNHKIIDLKPPFQTLGEFLAFAKNLLDKDDVPFTKRFQQNLEIQYSKSYSISKLKMCILHNMRSKQANQVINHGPVKRVLEGKDDKVSLICNYLTNLEICILLLAAKLIYLREFEQFNCNDLLGLMKEIPSQISNSSNQRLLFMAVGTLIEYGVFEIEEKKSLQKQKLWLTEWTPLSLNVFRFQIDESLKRLNNKIPTGVSQLFTIQAV